MIRTPLHTLFVIAAAGALVPGLRAQVPAKPIKPATPATMTMHPPAAPPAAAPAAPPPQGGTGGGAMGPICHATDFSGHTDSPRSLMASCLNKQVQLNSESMNYQLIAVSESGFVLQRIPEDASGHRGIKLTRFIPWSSVLYYNMIGDFMDIVLVRV
jgi:hypothetical protein